MIRIFYSLYVSKQCPLIISEALDYHRDQIIKTRQLATELKEEALLKIRAQKPVTSQVRLYFLFGAFCPFPKILEQMLRL